MQLTEQQQLIMQGKVCPYCKANSQYIDSAAVYSNGVSYGMVYLCSPCKAWVGVHKSRPTEALGRLANAELRKAKKDAHEAFDALWKDGTFPSRKAAYKWLSNELEIPIEYCHIGMMGVKTCRQVIELVKHQHETI